MALGTDLRAVIGPLLKEPGELDATDAARDAAAQQADELQALLVRLKDELPLWPQELRVYCLRLARAGCSVRRIAALVDSSKSSVARYCAAGLAGIDWETLVDERRKRLWDLSPESEDDNLSELAMLDHEMRRLGLHRHRADDLEQRVLIPELTAQTTASKVEIIAPYTDNRLRPPADRRPTSPGAAQRPLAARPPREAARQGGATPAGSLAESRRGHRGVA